MERRKESSLNSSDSGGKERGEERGKERGVERGKTVTCKEPSSTYRYVLELKSTPTILKVRKKT